MLKRRWMLSLGVLLNAYVRVQVWPCANIFGGARRSLPSHPATLGHDGCRKPGKGLWNGEGFPSPSCFGQAWDHRELPATLPQQYFRGKHHHEVQDGCIPDGHSPPCSCSPGSQGGATWPFYRENAEKTAVKSRGEEESEAQRPSQHHAGPALSCLRQRAVPTEGIESQTAAGESSQEGKKEARAALSL